MCFVPTAEGAEGYNPNSFAPGYLRTTTVDAKGAMLPGALTPGGQFSRELQYITDNKRAWPGDPKPPANIATSTATLADRAGVNAAAASGAPASAPKATGSAAQGSFASAMPTASILNPTAQKRREQTPILANRGAGSLLGG